MKIAGFEIFHADGGWRTLSFLKIISDTGLSGWSEFSQASTSPALGAVISALGTSLVGRDPLGGAALAAELRAATRPSGGGLDTLAIAAIENACLDLRARHHSVPVYDLLGGALRTRFPLYWSQCATLRARFGGKPGFPRLDGYDGIAAAAAEVKQAGFAALKSNILVPDGMGGFVNHRPGFGPGPGYPDRVVDTALLAHIEALFAALRAGAGPDVELMLDLNFNTRPEGARRVAEAARDFGISWLELDLPHPKALRELRGNGVAIASLETVLGASALRPYLEARAVDIAIIDPQWNGVAEAVTMARLADAFDVMVAPHNFHGPLSTLMGAHMCAAIGNMRSFEIVMDEAPWIPAFLHAPLDLREGHLHLGDGPGWGIEVNEAALTAKRV